MNKKLILHIGSYKTGSTSIQNSLFKNSEWLLQNNYMYLFSDIEGGINPGNGKQLSHIK